VGGAKDLGEIPRQARDDSGESDCFTSFAMTIA